MIGLSESYRELVDSILSRVQSELTFSGTNLIGDTDSTKTSPALLLFLLVSLDRIKVSSRHDFPSLFSKMTSFVQSLCPEKDIQNPKDLLQLFLDEDDKLIELCFGLVTLVDEEGEIHSLMHQFLQHINFDAQVLLDWLTSDQETSLPLLKLLLFYLKQPKELVTSQTQATLKSLADKLVKLSDKKLLPFDFKPLLRLMIETQTNKENEDSCHD